ncbi:MAG: FAD-dependent pyridine nucleotide-disulfide oxidoreductase [Conexibacter sp.]|nr:FAD-dependent pyridine nucleotide-disulfide oxidoreductase [Conexibacter sp.]
MPLPVLLVIDGDQDALEDVAARLVRRYGLDYRVESASDPEQALGALAELADAGDELALVLAATSLSDATGGGLLQRARQLHPHAKRGLMVAQGAWADPPTAETIVDSIAMGRIDYYVPVPANAPDEVFHHTISTFLLEWATERRKVPDTVHIVGEEWSGRAYELRETFERCAVPHDFCLAESDEGRILLARAGPDAKLPVMLLPDGRALSDPSNAEIAEAAGAPADFDERDFDVVIVGAGPAGLSAAVYGASEGLRTLVVDEGGIGGQARSSSLIRNYLGFPRGVSGHRLAEQAYEQASVFGASFVFMHRVTALSRSREQLTLSLTEGRRVSATAVILATGASYRRLGVPTLEALTGAGVFYGGPASEAHALSGADVFVAGGGNSAGQAVLYLARYARRVTLIVRGASLDAGMSHYLIQEIQATPGIDVRISTTVVGGGGDGRLRQLVLRDASVGNDETVAADALFVLIGTRPHTDWLPPDIARDRTGFLYTGEDVPNHDGWLLERPPSALETSMSRVLAAGDVRHGSVKRVASAVGEGSIAVQLVHNLLAAQQSAEPRSAAGARARPR